MPAGATVTSILLQEQNANDDLLKIITALNNSLNVTQAQLDQISGGLDVIQANINIIKTKLGIV